MSLLSTGLWCLCPKLFYNLLCTPLTFHFWDRATILEIPDADFKARQWTRLKGRTGSHFGTTGCWMLDFSLLWDTLTGLWGSSTSIDSEFNLCEWTGLEREDENDWPVGQYSMKPPESQPDLQRFCFSTKPVQVLVVKINIWILLCYY